MERYEAEQLLKLYKSALFDKFKDWGDHPSQTTRIDVAVARLEDLLIQKLTEPRPSRVENYEVVD
jgi:hypothetical protein